MYQPGTRQGTVKFGFKPAKAAQKVQLAGDFSGWKPLEMRKQKDGQYIAEVAANSAVVQYKFVVDGQWTTDPDHSDWAHNPFGTMNSVAKLRKS